MRLRRQFFAIWVALLFLCQFASPQFLPAQTKEPDAGHIENDVYRNSALGFSCKIPFAWVDRTQAMQGGSEQASKSQVLLAVFERPPEATGDTINSGIVIAVESASAYPKVKTALDYFEPLSEAATSQGFKASNEPYRFTVGSGQLTREDFSKERGKLTMYQSSLVMMKKGMIVSFTFIAGSQDDVEELAAGLHLAPNSAPKRRQLGPPRR
jgi:hypothetical protein